MKHEYIYQSLSNQGLLHGRVRSRHSVGYWTFTSSEPREMIVTEYYLGLFSFPV